MIVEAYYFPPNSRNRNGSCSDLCLNLQAQWTYWMTLEVILGLKNVWLFCRLGRLQNVQMYDEHVPTVQKKYPE